MKKKSVIIIILAVSFAMLKFCWAQDRPGGLWGVEVLTGYGQGALIQKKDYRVIPIMMAFDFDIKPLTEKIGFNPPGIVQFQLEPFLSLILRPETNMEVGTSFMLKLGLSPEGSRVQPFAKGGVGMIYMTQHTLDQSTQFNFLINFGAGMHYFLRPDYAFTFEYRFRHLSNAGIKEPNRGVDVHFGLFGVTRLF